MATTALIAYIAAAKYAWQSTLYRQAQILAGWGFVVDRQTLARWMKSAAWVAQGLYELQLKTMHGFERLFCDETPMPVLDPGRGRTTSDPRSKPQPHFCQAEGAPNGTSPALRRQSATPLEFRAISRSYCVSARCDP